jgi:hypothetical protein
MASSGIPEEQKGEQVEVVSQIGQEAAKEKPNRTLMRALTDGLFAGAFSCTGRR